MARIEDYALIGDLQTAALVARDGSIDWLCFPRFDSGACFAALLGEPDNGRWLLAPHGGGTPTRALRRRHARPRDDVGDRRRRRARARLHAAAREGARRRPHRRGRARPRARCARSSSSASTTAHVVPWVRRIDGARARDRRAGRTLLPDAGAHARREHAHDLDVRRRGGRARPVRAHVVPVARRDPGGDRPGAGALRDGGVLDATGRPDAARTCPPSGADVLRRSLIVLKALTYEPTGGIVAAPTTSLPEWIGGERNWDYRYCWLRDATLTLLALLHADYAEEAAAWRVWLLRAVAGSPSDIQIMYGVAGERRLTELELPWLSGYEGSVPVRVGNAASEQLQIDVFGEVMDALYQARAHGLPFTLTKEAWALQTTLLEYLERIWREPDEGIWEIRGEPRHFVHSKVMAWVAFDRAVRTVETQSLRGAGRALARAPRRDPPRRLRARLRRASSARSRSRTARRSSTRASCSSRSSASSPPSDPRVRGTVEAIERTLVSDGFVLRYRTTRRASTACPPARASSCRARSGSSTASSSSAGTTTRTRCSSASSRSRTTSACSRRSTTRGRSGCWATSRRRSPISRS